MVVVVVVVCCAGAGAALMLGAALLLVLRCGAGEEIGGCAVRRVCTRVRGAQQHCE